MRNKLILLVILLLGLFFRIYDLNSESLWVDEGIALKVAHSNLYEIIMDRLSVFHPPLYYIILHYWVALFGDTEFSIRFVSFIFGFFAIFMIYKVGSLIFDQEVGILSSLLLALSVFHIYYSQEARMYSLVALLTLFSFYFFIRLLNEKSYIVSINYIIFSLLLIYTHCIGLLVIIAQNIYFVTQFLVSKEDYRSVFKKWVLIQFLLILLFIPWLSMASEGWLMHQLFHGQFCFFSCVQRSIRVIATSLVEWSGSKLLLLFFLLLSFFSMVNYEVLKDSISRKDFFKIYRWKTLFSRDNKIYLLLIWLSVPLVSLSFLLFPMRYSPKHAISALLALYLLVAKGISNIRNRQVKLVIISIIIVLSLASIWKYYIQVDKAQWREATNYIEAHIKPNDLLLFLDYRQRYLFDYYSRKTGYIEKKILGEDIDIADYSRIWFLQGKQRRFVEKLVEKTLGRTHKVVSHTIYSGIYNIMGQTLEVYLFEKI